MQRIACRYRRDATVAMLGTGEVRALLMKAAVDAGLKIDEMGKHAVVMGPPLPPGATSEDERCVLTLETPGDPGDVMAQLNDGLPGGLKVEAAWIAAPGSSDEAPQLYGEAEYEVLWRGAPPAVEVNDRTQALLVAAELRLERARENRTQVLNARAAGGCKNDFLERGYGPAPDCGSRGSQWGAAA